MTGSAAETSIAVPTSLLMSDRRDRRVRVPSISLRIAGNRYATRDWSLGGFLIEGYEGTLTPGDRFELDGIGPGAAGPLYPLAVPAQVVRVEGERLAARFEVLPPTAFDILEGMMMRRSRYLAEAAGAA